MSDVIKHTWYQTEDKMVVNILIKNAEERNCKVTIEQDRLLVEAEGDNKLELHLCEPINVEKSFYKFGSVKVEVTLMKLVGRIWPDLTKEKAETKPTVVKIYGKDWDAIEKDVVENEKKEGGGDESTFFKSIYEMADPDSRKAIIKSFTESNGTVLSMNWEEVRAQKTEVKPPDGTEFKEWKKA